MATQQNKQAAYRNLLDFADQLVPIVELREDLRKAGSLEGKIAQLEARLSAAGNEEKRFAHEREQAKLKCEEDIAAARARADTVYAQRVHEGDDAKALLIEEGHKQLEAQRAVAATIVADARRAAAEMKEAADHHERHVEHLKGHVERLAGEIEGAEKRNQHLQNKHDELVYALSVLKAKL